MTLHTVYIPEHTLDLRSDPMDEVFHIQTQFERERFEESQRHVLALHNIERSYDEAMFRFNLDQELRHQLLTSLRMIYVPLP